MTTLAQTQIQLENKIKRLRSIHYIISKVVLFNAFDLADKSTRDLVAKVIDDYCGNDKDLKLLKIKLAVLCEDVVSQNTLRQIARDYGVVGCHKLTKSELVSRLKGIR